LDWPFPNGFIGRDGGDIGVESSPGQGSTFWFTLPSAACPTSEASQPFHPLEGQSALVLVPNESARSALVFQLASLGASAQGSASPQSLISHLELRGAPAPDWLFIEQDWATGAASALLKSHLQKASETRMVILVPATSRTRPESVGFAWEATLPRPFKLSVLRQLVVSAIPPTQLQLSKPVRVLPENPDLPKVTSPSANDPLPFAETPVSSTGTPAQASIDALDLDDSEPPGPLRILAAEDNPVNQKLILKMLKKLGYDAELARDGTEAVAAATQNTYDLMILDYHMPGHDGVEVARQVRQLETLDPERTRSYISALTASVFETDRRNCEEAGMDDFVAKPLRSEDLRRLVCRASSLVRRRAAAKGA